MNYVIPTPEVARLPVAGSDAVFPIRRVFCIGKNYTEHVREMGGDPAREEPLFFTKPADAVVGPGAAVPYPPGTSDLHYEVELIAALGDAVSPDASDEGVLTSVLAYGVGVDLTRRDLQAEAKKRGRPWDMSKAFDASALCSELHLASVIGHPNRGEIGLNCDGVTCQRDDIANMVWSLPDMLRELAKLIELKPGDLVYTGTPSGVGPVERGQRLEVWVDGVDRTSWTLN
ncbi:MAG: fumarylacetoacetate hydrolase family protein [Pseudomonadota bacterium]